MVEIKLVNLTKRFGNVVAVDHLNLTVKHGELLVLLGPSGCGKTTTLRLIAGLESPDEGEIYFDNTLVNDMSPKDRNVAMVFQDYALYPHMTAYDNIAFPLRNRGYSESNIRRKVLEVAEMLNIKELLNRKPRQLSGGQKQRVALARAIVREPNVFLLDEPLSNLDAKLKTQMRVELRKLQKRLGVTTVYVTHDQAEAMSIGDRIAVMKNGKLLQVGTPEEVYENPKNMFVASFIGSPSMNFIKCIVKLRNGFYVLDCGDFKINISYERGREVDVLEGEEVILGIRPEDITILPERSSNAISASIELIEPLRPDMLIHLRIGNIKIVARSLSTLLWKPDDHVSISFNLRKLHIFRKNGEKIM